MPKKTLNEATIRQFMKLANHKPATISTFIKENYMEKKEVDEAVQPVNEEETVEEAADPVNEEEVQAEGMYEEEGEELDAEMPPAPEPDAEMDAVADVAGGGELDITPEMAQALIEFGEMLAGAMGAEAGAEEPPMDDEMGDPVGDEPAPDLDAAPEEEVMEGEENIAEAEEGTVSEEQIVQEVARRVAKRILKARKAQKNLNDALGNK